MRMAGPEPALNRSRPCRGVRVGRKTAAGSRPRWARHYWSTCTLWLIHDLSHRRSGRSSRSTARRCPGARSRASCSATRRGPSPALRPSAAAASSRPTAARCSSTRSATCRQPQAKLLRFLKDREVHAGRRSTVEINVDNPGSSRPRCRPTRSEVKAGPASVPHLCYRSRESRWKLRPLRERRADIIHAVGHLAPVPRRSYARGSNEGPCPPRMSRRRALSAAPIAMTGRATFVSCATSSSC